MAIDLTLRSIIPIGDRNNRQQSIVLIPAEASADKPGILVLGNVDGSGTVGTGGCFWFDNTGVPRYGTDIPTDEDLDGTVIGAATGASLALDNLVSVQIADTLAFSAANTYDIGDDPDSIRTLYWTTSLKKIGTTYDVTLAATEPAAASYTYTFPDAAANADVMLDTGGSNAITVTSGTASIALASGNTDISLGAGANITVGAAGNVDFGTGAVAFNGTAAFDQATATTVNIDQNVTVQGGALTTSSACTLDQDLAAAQSPTWVGLTLTGAIATPTNITMSGYLLMGDDQQIRLGGSGANDSYIQYDSTANKLEFFDRDVNAVYSLSQLVSGTPLNPIVTGDLTISDGQFDWTNTSTSDINTWDFGATTVDTFDIVCDNTTAAFLDIEADSFTAHGTAAEGLIDINVDAITSGNVIVIDTNQAGSFTGSYLKFYTDGSTDAFTVKGYGATTIAGVARGTDALTLTAGDIKVTDGWLDIDSGNTDGGHNIATSANATNNTDLVTITNSDAAFDKQLLVIDGNMNTGVDAAAITYAGTAAALHITTEAAAGWGIDFDVAASHTDPLLYMDMGAWVGTAGEGIIHIFSDSGAVAEAGHAIHIDLGGTTADAAAISGKGLYIKDAGGTQAGSYLVHLESTNNDAVWVAAGEVKLNTDCHLTGGTNAGSTGVDLQFYGDTANRSVKWDSANDQFQLLDGTTTFKFESGSTSLDIDGSAANDILNLGKNTDMDVVMHGTTAGMDVEWNASDNQLNLLANAELNLDGPIVMSGIQAITDATDTDIVHPCTTINTTGGAQTSALIDGQEGQMKYILMIVDGGNWVETPANFKDGTTITFDDVGDDAFLVFLGSNWNFIAGSATVA